MKMDTLVDVRDVLPAIRVPAVVMHRTGDRDANVEEGRYIAARIRGARFAEFPAPTIPGGRRTATRSSTRSRSS